MMTRSCVAVVGLVLSAAAAAQAQPNASEWLASAAAREFRGRVVQLAVLYGDSRGIDPRGLLVTARRMEDAKAKCPAVEVAVLAEGKELLHEQVQVCHDRDR
jgi:hypothetical protein